MTYSWGKAHFQTRAEIDRGFEQAIQQNLIVAYLETDSGERQRLDAATHKALTMADRDRDDIVYESLKH